MPILDCPNGMTSVEAKWNSITFKEGMAEYIEATHGDIACIFRTGEYPVYTKRRITTLLTIVRLKILWD